MSVGSLFFMSLLKLFVSSILEPFSFIEVCKMVVLVLCNMLYYENFM